MFAMTTVAQSDGLTLDEIIRGIPHDGPAIVIYVMLLAFVGFIWMGSRRKSS